MLGNARKTIIENFERIYRDLLMYNTKAKSPYLRANRSLNIHLSHASLTSYSMECSGVFMLAAVPLVHIYVFKVNPADTLRLKQEQRTQIATNMQYIIIH